MFGFGKPESVSEIQASDFTTDNIPLWTKFGRMPRCRLIHVRLKQPYIYISIYIYIYMYMCVCVCVCVCYTFIRVCVCMCVCLLYIYSCVCVCVCVCEGYIISPTWRVVPTLVMPSSTLSYYNTVCHVNESDTYIGNILYTTCKSLLTLHKKRSLARQQ